VKRKFSRSKFNFSGETRGNLLSKYAAEAAYEDKVQKYDEQVEAEVKRPKSRKYLWFFLIAAFSVILLLVALAIFLLSGASFDKKLVGAKKSKELYQSDLTNVSKPSETAYKYLSRPTLPAADTSVINAKAFYVFSPELSEVFASKNPEKKYSIASITKLMTASTALEVFNEDESVCVLEETRLYGSIDLKKDDCFDRDQLVIHMLSSSSNDAAKQIELNAAKKNSAFINEMNLSADRLQLDNTHYGNVIGLDEEGNYSTAKDSLAVLHSLVQKVDTKEFLGVRSGQIAAQNTGNRYSYETTNLLLTTRKDIIGGKTGFTSEAGGTLIVIAQKPTWKFKIYAVLLGAEGEEERFEEMAELLDLVYAKYKL
jgi:D-alanyl-D-alanine carboxypeptidase